MSDNHAYIPGWFGKIPALGDFASRRLPQNFISLWDSWLQHSIATSQTQLGDKWLDIYLNSPIWRFILMPGLCGPKAWTGIIMPSVDKVGRYFPITIALSVEAHSDFLVTIFKANHWFDSIEQIALASLDVEFSMENLEQGLALHIFPAHYSDHEKNPAAKQLAELWQTAAQENSLQLPALEGMSKLIHTASLDLFSLMGAGKTIWWRNLSSYGSLTNGPVKWRNFMGLPAPNHFIEMLAGN